MLKDNLVKLGLTANEAETYLFLLDNYKAKASEIAKHLGVTHPAAKKILDSLLLKKIIRSKEYSKTTFYFPESGQKINEYIEDLNNKTLAGIEDKKSLANQVSKLLEAKVLLKSEAETNIKFYKGKDGILELSSLISNAKEKTVYEFIDTDLVLYNKSKDTTNWTRKYKERDLKFIVFYTSDNNFNSENELIKEKYKINRNEIDLPAAHILIFDNKVSFSFMTDDKTMIIIDNEWIANALRTMLKGLAASYKFNEKK